MSLAGKIENVVLKFDLTILKEGELPPGSHIAAPPKLGIPSFNSHYTDPFSSPVPPDPTYLHEKQAQAKEIVKKAVNGGIKNYLNMESKRVKKEIGGL